MKQFVRHPNANSLIRYLQNKTKRVLTNMQTKDATLPSQSVKPGDAYKSFCEIWGSHAIEYEYENLL
jgi:hypothetical protein